MRKSVVFVAAAGLALAATAANAQPDVQLDAHHFEGPYVGAAIGYGWTTAKAELRNPDFSFDRSGGGVIGGLFAGFGAVSGQLFGAVEGQALRSSADKSGFVDGFRINVEQRQTFSLMAKVGFVPTDRFLIYGTAGWAVTNFKQTTTSASFSDSSDDWFNGARVGIGAEFAVTRHIFTRFDYTHTWYGRNTYTLLDTTTLRLKGNENLFLIGAGYRF